MSIKPNPYIVLPFPGKSYGRWQSEAACGDGDAQTMEAMTYGFHTPGTARPLVAKYCHNCPVKRQCDDWARDDHTFTGIAGGVLYRDGGSSRRRVPLRIALAVEGEYVLGTDQSIHPMARRKHFIKDNTTRNLRNWKGLCGARVTANRTMHDEQMALASAQCVACRQIADKARK